MYPLRPNTQRAKHVTVSFYVLIALSVIELLFDAWQYYNYSTMDLSSSDELERFYSMIVWKAVLGFASIGAYIVTGVLFICWFRRGYFNLNQVNPGATSFTDGWAAGSWFVPILNLARPYQMMRELWVGTQEAVPHRNEQRPAAPVGFWWALYLAMGIAAWVLYIKTRLGFHDLSELSTYTMGEAIQELITIAAAVMALQIIKRVSAFESVLWEESQFPSDSVFAISSAEVPPASPASSTEL